MIPLPRQWPAKYLVEREIKSNKHSIYFQKERKKEKRSIIVGVYYNIKLKVKHSVEKFQKTTTHSHTRGLKSIHKHVNILVHIHKSAGSRDFYLFIYFLIGLFS